MLKPKWFELLDGNSTLGLDDFFKNVISIKNFLISVNEIIQSQTTSIQEIYVYDKYQKKYYLVNFDELIELSETVEKKENENLFVENKYLIDKGLTVHEIRGLTSKERKSLKDYIQFKLRSSNEHIPVFKSCLYSEVQNNRNCFQSELNKHITKHYNYPEDAIDLGLQGKVDIQFIIQKNGRIGSIKTRGSHKILEDDAKRITNLLPTFLPGIVDGKPTDVPFSFSINYRLK